METHLEMLINPLTDLGLIPPDRLSIVYKMPDPIEEVSGPPISGMDTESSAWETGPKTPDGIRCDVIMSWIYNNDVIGW